MNAQGIIPYTEHKKFLYSEAVSEPPSLLLLAAAANNPELNNASLTTFTLAPILYIAIGMAFASGLVLLSQKWLPRLRLVNAQAVSDNDAAYILSDSQKDIVENVYRFGNTQAHDLMVPRPDVTWLSTELAFPDVMNIVTTSGFTRFPLCEGNPDNVIGYIHIKDLATMPEEEKADPYFLEKLARKVVFVPNTAKAATLLHRFQKNGTHFAVVVDEFGGMAGILTLEDLLEELVGEIRDEFDEEAPEIMPLASGIWSVDGSVKLELLEERFSLDFGEREEETVGGYIFGRLAREVNEGEELKLQRATLRVQEVDGLRVKRVTVHIQTFVNRFEPQAPADVVSPPEVGSHAST